MHTRIISIFPPSSLPAALQFFTIRRKTGQSRVDIFPPKGSLRAKNLLYIVCMQKTVQVLILTIDGFYKDLLELILKQNNFRVRVTTLFDQLGELSSALPTIAWFIDLDAVKMTIDEVVNQAKKIAPDAKLVFLGSHFTKDMALSCLQHKAAGMLVKPFPAQRLVQVIDSLRQENELLDHDEIIPSETEVEDSEVSSSHSGAPDSSHPFLMKITYHCPVCKFEFEPSKFKGWVSPVSETDTDYCPICPGHVHPELYSAIVCPNCLFSHYVGKFPTIKFPDGMKKVFLEPKLFEERAKTAINLDFRHNRTLLHGVKSFELAALSCDQLKTKDRVRMSAEFYLKASWLCRRMGNPKNEREAQEKSLVYFQRLYHTIMRLQGTLPKSKDIASPWESGMEEPSERGCLLSGFLAGELSRRLGNMPDAQLYFDDVLKCPTLPRFTSLYQHIHAVYREFKKVYP